MSHFVNIFNFPESQAMVSVVVCTIPLHNNRPKIADLRNRIKLKDQQFYGLGFILKDTKMAACIFCVYTRFG